jgi:hypothetical protein
MNFSSILSALLPVILPLLNDPNFQSVLKAVENNLNNNVAKGATPGAAASQATGLLSAAALLHLTGNPVADFQSLLTSVKTSAKAMPQ